MGAPVVVTEAAPAQLRVKLARPDIAPPLGAAAEAASHLGE